MRYRATRPREDRQADCARSAALRHLQLEEAHDVAPILQLQRKIGNQAVRRLLQSGGRRLGPGAVEAVSPRHAGAGEKTSSEPRIGAPDDAFEREADRIADQVTSSSEPKLQRACGCGGTCSYCGQEQSGQDRLSTKPVRAGDAAEGPAPPIVRKVVSTPGLPLERSTREDMESRFGHDFGRVRVHRDAQAAESARAVNAAAYTLGSDVVFGAGHYAPNTTAGRRLLAHELAHVLQQSDGPQRVQRGGRHIKLTEEDKFEWDLAIARGEIERFGKLSTREKLETMQSILQTLRRISTNPHFADVDPEVRREITDRVAAIESTLSFFAKVRRENVKTVEEGGFSWAVVGGVAVADGPEPGPADLAALVAAIGMLLFASATVTTVVQDPDLARRQAETLREMLDEISETLTKVKPVPIPRPEPEPEPEPEPKPTPRTTDVAPPLTDERRRRNDCRRQHPFAMDCDDPHRVDRDEVVIDFLTNQGYAYDDLGDCWGMGSFPSNTINACMGAPGERWHCRVHGTNDEVSVFGCLCCHPDGSTGFEWHGAHWSVNLSRR